MILDIDYSKYNHKLTISYVNERGNKSFLETNTSRFKTYFFDEEGEFENWDGRKCSLKYTDQPSKFDIKTCINEMSQERQDLIMQKKFPNLYTFDIETEYNPEEKADPQSAKFPITTISICSPSMTTVVLGTKDIGSEEEINKRYKEYLGGVKFFKDSKLSAEFVYKKFDSEGDMLLYFLKNIVAKCTVLAGWNIWGFDWQYIQNRLEKFYPEISIRNASPVFRTKNKNVHGFFNKDEVVRLQIPQHTMLVDMMDVIADHDRVVLPMKESMSLDWISKESIGARKVHYDGSLKDLYEKDYDTYVLYNAIDSALVQLIDKHFKTMQLIYVYSNITKLPIDQCLGKIAVAEALFFEEFYNDGKKVVWEKKHITDRGKLQGAYVKLPIAGRYNYAMCFDFAGLYPSQVITCNLSVENYMYPEGDEWTEEELDNYRKDPNYFVSINNHVYKNDKDYAFKKIQLMLRANRNKTKYLAKDLAAQVIPQLEDVLANKKIHDIKWKDDIKDYMMKFYNVSNIEDIKSLGDVEDFKRRLDDDITYKIMEEIAFKLVGNSCYGGSSHISFFWFNIGMANDVTGESRNLFKMMDELSNNVMKDKFLENKDLHEMLNIEIDEEKYKKEVLKVKDVIVYGDTDSVEANTMITTDKGGITIEELFNKSLQQSKILEHTHTGNELTPSNFKILNYKDNSLQLNKIRRVIRHKVTKEKWRLRTVTGEEIICTGDHSLIVFRNGVQTTVKPREILKTDKILRVVK